MQWRINRITTEGSEYLELVCQFADEVVARCVLESGICLKYHEDPFLSARWTLREKYRRTDSQLFFRLSRNGATVTLSDFNIREPDFEPIINAFQDAEREVKTIMTVVKVVTEELEKRQKSRLQVLVNRIYDLEQRLSTLEQHLENLWNSYEELHQRLASLEKTMELHNSKLFHFFDRRRDEHRRS